MQDRVEAVSRQCLSYVAISHFAIPACCCRAREREEGREREGGREREREERERRCVLYLIERDGVCVWCVCVVCVCVVCVCVVCVCVVYQWYYTLSEKEGVCVFVERGCVCVCATPHQPRAFACVYHCTHREREREQHRERAREKESDSDSERESKTACIVPQQP